MSLRTRGPHVVEVTEYHPVQGDMGLKFEQGETHLITGVSIQPLSESEASDRGQAGQQTYRVYGAGTWPGGVYSRIKVIKGPDPGEYDQVGPARNTNMTQATQHFRVEISKRGTAAR